MTLDTLPYWLLPGAVSLSPDREAQLASIGANWLKLWEGRNDLSEADLLRLMYLEVAGKNRQMIFARLKFWYNQKRDRRERAEACRRMAHA